MTKLLIWLSVVGGLAWTAYFAVPTAIVATILVAQGGVPTFNLSDIANLGGFAVFAFAMYRLHVTSLGEFRGDLKAERELREKHAEAIHANTAATNRLTSKLEGLKS